MASTSYFDSSKFKTLSNSPDLQEHSPPPLALMETLEFRLPPISSFQLPKHLHQAQQYQPMRRDQQTEQDDYFHAARANYDGCHWTGAQQHQKHRQTHHIPRVSYPEFQVSYSPTSPCEGPHFSDSPPQPPPRLLPFLPSLAINSPPASPPVRVSSTPSSLSQPATPSPPPSPILPPISNQMAHWGSQSRSLCNDAIGQYANTSILHHTHTRDRSLDALLDCRSPRYSPYPKHRGQDSTPPAHFKSHPAVSPTLASSRPPCNAAPLPDDSTQGLHPIRASTKPTVSTSHPDPISNSHSTPVSNTTAPKSQPPALPPSSKKAPKVHITSKKPNTTPKKAPSKISYANHNTNFFRTEFNKLITKEGEAMMQRWMEFHHSKQCTVAKSPCIKVLREFCGLVGGSLQELAQSKKYAKLGTQTACACNSIVFLAPEM